MKSMQISYRNFLELTNSIYNELVKAVKSWIDLKIQLKENDYIKNTVQYTIIFNIIKTQFKLIPTSLEHSQQNTVIWSFPCQNVFAFLIFIAL